MPGCRLINLYGATENTADVTWYETASPRDQQGRVPIGRAIDNMQTYILDANQQLMPVGQAGELHVAGIGLAPGYLNQPALTAGRFTPHPFGAVPGTRLHKTGDFARYRPTGDLEYLGRLDQQIQRHGYRIELEEIESALEQHPTVQHAVVVQEDRLDDHRLVAYLVPSLPGLAPEASALQRFLQSILPDYMQPSLFVTLNALPHTPTGKIDRLALPAPVRSRPELETAFYTTRSATEEIVAGIWSSLFGLEQVGLHDHFFDLGGHSLLAVRVVSRLRDALHIELPLQALFDAPTVAALSRHIEAAQTTSRGIDAPAIAPTPRDSDAPLSVLQEPFWHFEQMIPGTALFHIR